MTSVSRYQVYCTTDNKWEYGWFTTEPTTCPINSGHTINAALTTLIETINQETKLVEASFDAFARQRVSNPYTILDLSHITATNDTDQETYVTTGTGTFSHSSTLPVVNMEVTDLGTVKGQSRRRGIYQPGKSLLVFITGILNNNNNAVGCTSRMGYYDNDDGYFFEYSNPNLYVVERSAGVDTKILQANWNKNTYGALNVSKALIFLFDFEWLGVGRVRAGVVIAGTITYVHEFLHSNLLTKPYMNLASQPIRYELFNTGASQPGKLMHICGSVISEGGFNPFGRIFCADMGITYQNVNTIIEPLVCVRLKSTSLKINVNIIDASVMSSASAKIRIIIYIFRDKTSDSFLTGTSWQSPSANSGVEYDIAASAINTTDGEILAANYMNADVRNVSINSENTTNIYITSNIQGNTDYICLCAQSFGGGEDLVGYLCWKEIL